MRRHSYAFIVAVIARFLAACAERDQTVARDTAVTHDSASGSVVGAAPNENKGQYATVNGLEMYYEIHGSGQPIILLHGALSTIDVDFGKVLPDAREDSSGCRHRAAGAWSHRGYRSAADV